MAEGDQVVGEEGDEMVFFEGTKWSGDEVTLNPSTWNTDEMAPKEGPFRSTLWGHFGQDFSKNEKRQNGPHARQNGPKIKRGHFTKP